MTSDLTSFILDTYEYSEFDFRDDDVSTIHVYADQMKALMSHRPTLPELLGNITQYTGRMNPLPDWSHKGAVIGIQGGAVKFDKNNQPTGGQYRIQQAVSQLNEMGAPLSAVWIQDWVGKRTNLIGSFLWWDWQVDRSSYPDWESMIASLEQKYGVKTLSYINPFLVQRPEQPSLFDTAINLDVLVPDDDQPGMPYIQKIIVFDAGLLDLFNPASRDWIKSIIKERILAAGVRGYMADFAEAYPILSAKDVAFHNQYPELWAQLHQEVMEETGLAQETLIFGRSGFTKSPGKTQLFWLGDQTTTWDKNDGIKSALIGLLSSGLSGQSLNHSDIGGYAALTPLGIKRSKQLFMRWAEMNAFSPFFRTHEGNAPDKNHQYNSDEETLAHFVKFSKVFAALFGYRKALMKEAKLKGWPLARPMVFYHNETQARNIWQQYYFGPDILVSPVLDASSRPKQGPDVSITLPQGNWRHLWTGARYQIRDGFADIKIPAPLGKPPVFLRESSTESSLAPFLRDLRRESIISW